MQKKQPICNIAPFEPNISENELMSDSDDNDETWEPSTMDLHYFSDEYSD